MCPKWQGNTSGNTLEHTARTHRSTKITASYLTKTRKNLASQISSNDMTPPSVALGRMPQSLGTIHNATLGIRRRWGAFDDASLASTPCGESTSRQAASASQPLSLPLILSTFLWSLVTHPWPPQRISHIITFPTEIPNWKWEKIMEKARQRLGSKSNLYCMEAHFHRKCRWYSTPFFCFACLGNGTISAWCLHSSPFHFWQMHLQRSGGWTHCRCRVRHWDKQKGKSWKVKWVLHWQSILAS